MHDHGTLLYMPLVARTDLRIRVAFDKRPFLRPESEITEDRCGCEGAPDIERRKPLASTPHLVSSVTMRSNSSDWHLYIRISARHQSRSIINRRSDDTLMEAP